MNENLDDQWIIFMVGNGMGDKLNNLINNLKNSQNRNLAYEFISASELDLELSITLNNKRVYSLAVFHLQQSVEKLCKALFLFVNKIEADNNKLYCHNSLKIVEDWLFENNKKSTDDNGKNIDEGLTSNTQNQNGQGIHSITEILKSEKGLLRNTTAAVRGILIQSIEDVLKNLGFGNSLEEIFKHERDKGKSVLFEKYREVVNAVSRFSDNRINELFDQIKRSNEITRYEADRFKSGYTEKQFAFINSVIYLFALAFVTSPHEDSSRYPISKLISFSFEEYQKSEVGIVKVLPILLDITKSAVNSIKETFS